MFRDRGLESFDRSEDQVIPAKSAQEAETAAWPCHQPCPYDDEGGYHTCLLDANHDGRHFCDHKHAW